jgi:hypothetical protein
VGRARGRLSRGARGRQGKLSFSTVMTVISLLGGRASQMYFTAQLARQQARLALPRRGRSPQTLPPVARRPLLCRGRPTQGRPPVAANPSAPPRPLAAGSGHLLR